MVMNDISKPEDQWSCKRSPDILAYDIYMMYGKGQGNLINLHLLIELSISTHFQVKDCNNFQRMHHCHTFLYKAEAAKFDLAKKIGHGQPRVII